MRILVNHRQEYKDRPADTPPIYSCSCAVLAPMLRRPHARSVATGSPAPADSGASEPLDDRAGARRGCASF
ncbi:hypothetical protein EVAR_93086_1 [Eumeta japonica]|uniref:Uncharacterized protein n=1 Tax=Eumeta variegata TaxID=151549 RepID=A0A4C1TIA0_EUMVA|nr:hypothetical protein EVAR_93086_1 [Eumeta japonica]